MIELELSYDLFVPSFAAEPIQSHYAAMLDQLAYADAHGFTSVYLTEHHGTDEGYLPSPLVAAAAAAGRTRNLALRTLLVTPFYEPVKLAEDLAVVDVLSGGRMVPIFAAGYVEREFEMFGRARADRRTAVEGTIAFLREAWTGVEFEFEGRRVRVTPTPVQHPHPPIMMAGTSRTAARAAARLADGFVSTEHWHAIFREECRAVGRADPGPAPRRGPFIHVAEDPERDFAAVAPFLLALIRAYHDWTTTNAGGVGARAAAPFAIRTERELRESDAYRIVTPDECVALIGELGDHALVRLNPGWGGYDTALAWSSLELFVTRVIPRLEPATLRR